MKRNPLVFVIAAIVVIIVGAVVWWLASPLFLNQTVNDQLPASVNATLPPGLSRPNAEATMMSAAKLETKMDDAMPASVRPEAKIKTGTFRDNGDGFHKGSGIARIYAQPDGTYLLRLENFNATNGPDLHVYLSPAADPKTNAQVLVDGYVDLAVLKGNIGNQNYPIPANIDITKQNSVIIWCKAFSVIFAVAPLTPSNS